MTQCTHQKNLSEYATVIPHPRWASYNRQYGRDYRSVMPTNLYGPNDNYHPENSHVIPALLRWFHEAVQSGAHEVAMWGGGETVFGSWSH
jgi:nucleoside-diphosphate-sugar epimerase